MFMPNKNFTIAISVILLCIVVGVGLFFFDQNKNNQTQNQTQNQSETVQSNNSNSNSSTTNTSNGTSNTTNTQANTAQSDQGNNYNNSRLATFNGLNGNKCYVAVDGKVYDLSNFSLWRNGVHTPSGGSVSCGKELSQAMQSSPHGKSKLRVMPEVGVYTN
jgi:predicted heme/steroid binding protein